MATQPTNLPVPSESYRDLKYNAGKIDEFVTSLTLQYIDRFGNAHYTIEGLRWLAQQAIAQYGWIPVGTFQDGATLTTPNQILKDETDGEYYRWDGAFPKLVPSGSTPSTSGGTGVGAWLSVGDSTLRAMLAAPGGDKLIGSSWGGASVWEDYPYKGNVRPSKVIYPTMSNSQIQTILAAGGEIYVSDGVYDVSSSTETWKLAQNSRIYFSANSLLRATANNVTVLRMSSLDVSSSFIRNCKAFMPRISLNGKTGCIGIHVYSARNNSSLEDPWVDMTLGTGCIGIQIEFMSYGVIVTRPEVLNGNTGGTRILIRNGPNAISIRDHRCYSGVPADGQPDRSITVLNGLDGSFSFDYITTFPTASVNITGGYSQNTNQYGLLDSGVSTYVDGVYFENNAVSDVSLGSGSYYFTSIGTHHSLNVGGSCFRGRGANYAKVGVFGPATRSLGQYDFDSACKQCSADGSQIWGDFLNALGTLDGLRLDLGMGSIKQYSTTDLPIKIREGYRSYRLNVTSGLNIAISGTPYDGQVLSVTARGSNIASLTFAGVPVDVTGANTATTKTGQFTATYWASIGKWTLSMPQWTASA
ncbi:phage tail protein [Enterobacter hormaechei]|nr:phage tail protein [Enterobacter hormaechei]EKT9839837.1 phage tail protein [Enterobacter hormaechei]ELD3417233.1 phage tail protein [Enterobacter hormaechei]